MKNTETKTNTSTVTTDEGVVIATSSKIDLTAEVTNTDRARLAARALKAGGYVELDALNEENPDIDLAHQAIKDLLGDLRHLCDRVGVEFDAADGGGYGMYSEEKHEDETGEWAHYKEVTL